MKRILPTAAIVIVSIPALTTSGWGITRFVRNPNQIPGIQACLNASQPGDSVQVDWNQAPYVGNFVVPAGVNLKGNPGFQGRPMLRPADPDKPVVEMRTNAAVAKSTLLYMFDIQEGDNSGVYIIGGGWAYLRNNEIRNNTALKGAGVHSNCSGRVNLILNYITDNTAVHYGGGIFFTGGGSARNDQNEIKGNTARRGGGIEIRGPLNCTITDRTFMENSAEEGGGIAVIDNPRTTTITGMEFFDNDATVGNGGTVYASNSVLLVEDCLISGGGCVLSGGGLYGVDSTITLDGCEICGNTAQYGAGAALSGRLNANSSIEGNKFVNNRASYRGGAVWLTSLPRMNVRNNFFDRNLAPMGSGVFVASNATASIYANSFAHTLNLAVIGTTVTEAVRLQGRLNLSSVANNIIAHHRAGIVGDGGNLAWAGWNEFWQVNPQRQIVGVRNAGGNNPNLNPLFVVFNANGAGDFDLHLQVNSPSRGTANAAFAPPDDFDGDLRDSLPDRGADEIVDN